MYKDLEHPEITRCLRTGYPSWMEPDEEEYNQEAYESYCDALYDQQRDRELFGE